MRYNDIFYQNLSNDNHSGSGLLYFFCDFLFIFFIFLIFLYFPFYFCHFCHFCLFFCDTIGIAGNVLGGVWRKILLEYSLDFTYTWNNGEYYYFLLFGYYIL